MIHFSTVGFSIDACRGDGPPKVSALAKSHVPESSKVCGNFKRSFLSSLRSSYLGATAISVFSRGSHCCPPPVWFVTGFYSFSWISHGVASETPECPQKRARWRGAQCRSPIYVRSMTKLERPVSTSHSVRPSPAISTSNALLSCG